MELLKPSRRRSQLSEIAHVVLNIGLAVTLLLVALYVNSLPLLIGIVLLGKWRVLAVRPRYWTTNIVANTVDIIVGVGHAIILFSATGQVGFQVFLTLGFIAWLLFIKPRSKRVYVTVQALTAVFIGTTALSMLAYNTDPFIFVLGMWVIGHAFVRHTLSTYEETYTKFYSLVWGVILAQFGWLGYHWMFAYTLPNSGNFKLVQLALIVTLLSFLAERVYASYHKHQTVQASETLVPIAFSLGLIFVLIVFFNQITIGGTL
jgi:hypothetical protein